MRKQLFLAVVALALPLAAGADEATAPAASVQDSYAPPSCKKPLLPSVVRRADDTDDFDQKVDAYKDCMNLYISTQNDLAIKHTAAGNAAVKDFNEFAKKVAEFKDSRTNQ